MWNRFVERWQLLAREQQISVVILTLCGGLAITLSLLRIQASVREPFLVRKDSIIAAKKIIGASEQQKLEREQRIDTDGDGLSDWDEVNTYKTNPNLRDTCGDGIPDNIRIATGKNISCDGVTQTGSIDTSGIKQPTPFSPTDIQIPEQVLDQGAVGAINQLSGIESQKAFIEQMLPRDPKLIRSMLSGKVDEARLKEISDEDLLKLYDSALKDQNAAVQVDSAGTTQTTSTSPSSL